MESNKSTANHITHNNITPNNLGVNALQATQVVNITAVDPTLIKDMIKKYTQEYALDEGTRVKAEELYKEFMLKVAIPQNNNSKVRKEREQTLQI